MLLLDRARLTAISEHRRNFQLSAFSVVLLCGVALALVGYASLRSTSQITPALVFVALLALPVLRVAFAVVQTVICVSRPPTPLPRVDGAASSMVAQGQVAVAVPVLIRTMADVDAALRSVEAHQASMLVDGASVHLLVDFFPFSSVDHPDDAALASALREGVERLNTRAAGSRLCGLFIRRRTFSARDKVWRGWERKRGKLIEFMRLARGGETSFADQGAGGQRLTNLRFVITLDRDARLCDRAFEDLCDIVAHPLNHPELVQGAVVQGYGVVAPRIVLRRPPAASRFWRWTYPQAGAEPGLQSSYLQDWLGQDLYVGKAMIDIDAFLAATDGLPEGELLSHDHLEGLHARCALATDIRISEDAPETWIDWRLRQSRWIRGDFQLLPWILGARPRPRERIPGLSRLVLTQNLIHHLAPVAGTAAAILVWLGYGDAPAWMGWVALAFLTPEPFTVPVQLGIPKARLSPGETRLTHMMKAAAWAAKCGVVACVFALDRALMTVSAAALTLYRLGVSRRHLLDWEGFGGAGRKVGLRVLEALLGFCLSVGLLIGVVALNPQSLGWNAAVLIVWTAVPILAFHDWRVRSCR